MHEPLMQETKGKAPVHNAFTIETVLKEQISCRKPLGDNPNPVQLHTSSLLCQTDKPIKAALPKQFKRYLRDRLETQSKVAS